MMPSTPGEDTDAALRPSVWTSRAPRPGGRAPGVGLFPQAAWLSPPSAQRAPHVQAGALGTEVWTRACTCSLGPSLAEVTSRSGQGTVGRTGWEPEARCCGWTLTGTPACPGSLIRDGAPASVEASGHSPTVRAAGSGPLLTAALPREGQRGSHEATAGPGSQEKTLLPSRAGTTPHGESAGGAVLRGPRPTRGSPPAASLP